MLKFLREQSHGSTDQATPVNNHLLSQGNNSNTSQSNLAPNFNLFEPHSHLLGSPLFYESSILTLPLHTSPTSLQATSQAISSGPGHIIPFANIQNCGRSNRVKRACIECIRTKRKCSTDRPCDRCSAKKILCTLK